MKLRSIKLTLAVIVSLLLPMHDVYGAVPEFPTISSSVLFSQNQSRAFRGSLFTKADIQEVFQSALTGPSSVATHVVEASMDKVQLTDLIGAPASRIAMAGVSLGPTNDPLDRGLEISGQIDQDLSSLIPGEVEVGNEAAKPFWTGRKITIAVGTLLFAGVLSFIFLSFSGSSGSGTSGGGGANSGGPGGGPSGPSGSPGGPGGGGEEPFSPFSQPTGPTGPGGAPTGPGSGGSGNPGGGPIPETPEPSSLFLTGMGLLVPFLRRRKKKVA